MDLEAKRDCRGLCFSLFHFWLLRRLAESRRQSYYGGTDAGNFFAQMSIRYEIHHGCCFYSSFVVCFGRL